MAETAQQSRFKLKPSVPKTRLGLSLAERIKVIEARKMGKSMRQLATQFGCGKTQILNTLTQKDRYVHEWEVMGRNNPSIGARKRFRNSRNEDINRSVYDWYQQQTASEVRVTGPMLQKQAKHYATLLEISNFGASNGWLANFRRFYNIVNSSPHPKQHTPNITFHQYTHPPKNKEVDQATSTRYHESSEFVPVNFVCETNDTQSSRCPRSTEQDPLQEENLQPLELIDYGTNHLKSQIENIISMCGISEADVFKQVLCSLLSTSLKPPAEKEMTNNCNEKCVGSSPIVNHWKRRLLQLQKADLPICKDLGSDSGSEGTISKERRVPMLVPISPLADWLAELASFASGRGFLALTMKDECGHKWMEIRQSVAFFRVSENGYPTHLTRLIVDCGLQYFLEVLGQCVQRGSLSHNENNHSLNYTETAAVLSAMDGKYVVCAGVQASADRKADEFGLNAANEFRTANNMYLSLPDRRFRSNECVVWMDCRLGPKCGSCKEATAEFSTTPMDLRCYLPITKQNEF